MTPTIISYSRVSSQKQLRGTGLAQQKDRQVLERVSNQYELPIDERTFSDEGKSGFHSHNLKGELGKVLELIQQGSIVKDSILVISSLDRLTRAQTNEALELLLSIVNRGVRVYTAIDDKLYSSDSPNLTADLIISVIVLATAHEESLKKSHRTIGAAKKVVNDHLEGKRGKSGYGYRFAVGTLPFWITTDTDNSLMLCPTYTPIALEIVDRLIAGEGCTSITDWLNATYAPPKSHKKRWNMQCIIDIHRKPTLMGKFSTTIGSVKYDLDGYLPPLINEAKFYQLVGVRKQRDIKRKPNGVIPILTGIGVAKCGCCGGSVISTTSAGRTRFRCNNNISREANCTGVSVESKVVEDIILGSGLPYKLQPQTNVDNSKLDGLNLKRTALTGRLEQMTTDYMNNLSNVLATMLQATGYRLQATETELSELDKEIEQNQIDKAMFQLVLTEIPSDRESQRQWVKQVFKSVEFHKVARGQVIVRFIANNGFTESVFIKNGKLIKQGHLTGSFEGDLELLTLGSLSEYVASGMLQQWLDS